MYSAPPVGTDEPFVIHSMASEDIRGFGGVAEANGGGGVSSGVVFIANEAMFYPFTIDEPRTYAVVIWANGAVVSGNVDAGVYDADGQKKFTTGSTAQSGTTTTQIVTLGSTQTLQPGRYYLAIVMDNTTGQFVLVNPGTINTRGAGARSRTNSFPLPTDVGNWVGESNGRIPLFGISELATL